MAIITRYISSIQTKLILLFTLASIFAIVAIAIFGTWARLITIQSLDNALTVDALSAANEIDDFNDRSLQAITIAAQLSDFATYLEAQAQGEPLPEQAYEQIRIALDSLRVRPFNQTAVLSYALLDMDGHNIVDTTKTNEGTNEADQDYFTETTQTATTVLTPIYFEQTTGGVFYYIGAPIRSTSNNGTLVGILRARIGLSSLQSLLPAHLNQPTDNIILIDENRLRIGDTRNNDLLFRAIAPFNEVQFIELQASNAIPQLSRTSLVLPVPELASAVYSIDAETRYTGVTHPTHDEQMRVAVVALETQPWHLAYARPADIFYAPAQRLTEGMLAVSLLFLVGAFASAILLARIISKPIQKLTTYAKRASEGELDIKVDINTKDEIGILANTFNHMTGEIRHTNNTLEQRVAERTAELSDANAALEHEIEERKRLEAETIRLAVESERARILAGFIQDASHEFKTPLSIINVQTHMISRLSDEKVSKRVHAIQRQSSIIEALVNDMVLLTELDSDKALSDTSAIWIDELLSSLLMRIENIAHEKNITLTLEPLSEETKETQVQGRAKLLSTALEMLIENAIQFSPPETDVTIRVVANESNLDIIIQDKGIGITPQHIARVFERFFRVDEARTERGFGLGLPIAQRIVELHKGTITLESILGEGTTVTVTLPHHGTI